MARPEVTGKKVGPRRRRRVGPPASERGSLAFSIPQAGAMIGLSRAKSYAEAKAGRIPTIEFSEPGHRGRKIVPKALWLKRLGVVESEIAPE